ncbi:MAG: ATP-grasp domain-containing protein, partial [Patescibacteria group bacterium]|nr:ATP-grasp domain-containing protein [Patescibacteria group bacterium]
GEFTQAWDLLADEKVRDIALDACWDRAIAEGEEFFKATQTLLWRIAERMPLANHPQLVSTSEDKYETFRQLPQYVPRTFLGSELEDARRAFTGRVVTKPRYGSHGNDVSVVDIAEVGPMEDDFVIQAFIDSAHGIPGIIEGVHDLRVTMLNGTIVDTYIRYPQEGLLSNVSKGGKMKMLDKETLPESVVVAARDIDTHFSKYAPRFYSIDFMLEEERPWIIELNKAPGIWGHIVTGVSSEYFKKLCMDIADAFADAGQRGARDVLEQI